MTYDNCYVIIISGKQFLLDNIYHKKTISCHYPQTERYIQYMKMNVQEENRGKG